MLGATLEADLLPIGRALQSQDPQTQLEFALNGGDDYELCFCAPPAKRDRDHALPVAHKNTAHNHHRHLTQIQAGSVGLVTAAHAR